jgi:hypothetical protein
LRCTAAQFAPESEGLGKGEILDQLPATAPAE